MAPGVQGAFWEEEKGEASSIVEEERGGEINELVWRGLVKGPISSAIFH